MAANSKPVVKPSNYGLLEGCEALGGVTTTCSHGLYPGRIKVAVCEGQRDGVPGFLCRFFDCIFYSR